MEHVTAVDGSRMPPEAALAMPVQSLREGRLDTRPLRSAPAHMAWRRGFILCVTAVLTLLATYQIWWLLRIGGIDLLEGLMLAVFVPLFAWIAQSFASSVAGFVLVLQRRPARLGIDPRAPLPTLAGRTALLMPTYNEDPERLLAGLQAIVESLQATGRGAHFDLFVLSDTRNADIQAREVLAFERLREAMPEARLYYRLRRDNHERKACLLYTSPSPRDS